MRTNKRLGMRTAGWIIVLFGFITIAAAAVSPDELVDLAGAYGVIFVLAGAWTLMGLALLERHERRSSQARASERMVTEPREVATR